MSNKSTDGPRLTGTGAAYLRVSGDKQELQRQIDSLTAFEKRHKVKVPDCHRYEDQMPRDLSAKRPDFQRMLKAALAGQLDWIFVDHIDRFGFADQWEFVEQISPLRKAGCRIFDAKDDEWTSRDLMAFFKVGLAGHTSQAEQRTKSLRSLGGMIARARAGEHMGGPPPLGFDLGCFDRASGKELFRVVFEGREEVGRTKRRGKERPVYHILRRKESPDGKSERFDGNNVEYRTNNDTQVIRIVPTKDKAKLAAVRNLFKRYATEAVTFFELARWLNGLGIRNSFGGMFDARAIAKILVDECYLGYATFRKRRSGRFHRYDAEGGVIELEPELYMKETASDPEDVILSRERIFDIKPPLVDRPTWDAVQKKLAARKKVSRRTAKNPKLYLKGLLFCSTCGVEMIARTDRMEYHCATRDRYRVRRTDADSPKKGRTLDDCPCERNAVRHALVEKHIERYLEEAGQRLELLTENLDMAHLTDHQEGRLEDAWAGFTEGLARLTGFLAQHHPEEYNAILQEADLHPIDGGLSPDDFVTACVELYRKRFDPSGITAEINRLEAELRKLVDKWGEAGGDLPTPRAKEIARERLAELEADIDCLKRQQEDASEVVQEQYREIAVLQDDIAKAKQAMRSDGSERALRHRAEALRSLLLRIDCDFVLTGKKSSGGPGQARSKPVAFIFHTIAGSVKMMEVEGDEATVRNRGYGKP